MRHFLAYVATYSIAVLLIVGAALFAWMRSAQLVVNDEQTALARFAPAAVHEFDWHQLGQRSYTSNCMSCHGADGRGWDQYPGIGHARRLFAAEGGREYLIDVHLYGLTSARWRAPMPPMGHMQDVELAAVLNHVLSGYGNERPGMAEGDLYVPNDISARRGLNLSPWDVERRRPPSPD